jgi:predicted ribosome quality control (RQC) complex YloA/Tae2 family protein
VKTSSDILWEYYIEKPLQEVVKQGKESLNKLIEKKLNKIYKLKKDIEKGIKGIKECEQEELYKRWAENLLSIPRPQRRNLKNIQTIDIYSHSSINIPLKENKTLIENAQYYFKKYKRLNKGENNLKKRKENIERELKFLQQVSFDIENAYSLKELNYLKNLFKPEKKRKKPHIDEVVKQLKIDEFTALMGENAIGNDIVTMSMANPTDFWFHVKDYPGAHIIIRNEKGLKELPQQVTMKAAKMVAKNSANRNTYADVDYTQKRYVRKPKGAKKGMVTYTHFYTIRVKNVNS